MMSSERPLDDYLHQVGGLLPGPRAARADIIAELRSGLLDGTDAHQASGLAKAAASEAAIREFGDPRDVAAAFAPELAVKGARRLSLTLVATGLPIGLLWTHAAQASDVASQHASFWQSAGAPPVPFAAAALLIAMLAALTTIAVTGRLTTGSRPARGLQRLLPLPGVSV